MHTFVIVLIVILVLIFIGQKSFFSEKFENIQPPEKLYVFLSETCKYCDIYKNEYHNDVLALMNSNGIKVQQVLSCESECKSNESNRLFAEYGVSGVPSGILVGGDKIVRLGSNITPQSVRQALDNWRY
jgi:thioredoxin-related protein